MATDVGVDAAQDERGGAAKALLREVEREIERDVLDGERTVALVVPRAADEGERSTRRAVLVLLGLASVLVRTSAAGVIVTKIDAHRGAQGTPERTAHERE